MSESDMQDMREEAYAAQMAGASPQIRDQRELELRVKSAVQRLLDRAYNSDRNAVTFDSSGYPGEAAFQRERAKAYRIAVEDVRDVFA